MDLQIAKAAAWLQDQVSKNAYSEIGVLLIVHDGTIKRIERTITEKIQE